ncbi:hypothetical protein ACQE3E_06720 [Methylomonas sp. MED-D]|uniref:hypothetical protein n=1 Tax=Methylomonas sp. MED-D TaxID=3418768 RepID=UPI003CFE3614
MAQLKKSKPGAKPGNTNAQTGDQPATSTLQIRVTPAEKAAWVHAAAGEKLSNWVRGALNRAARTD